MPIFSSQKFNALSLGARGELLARKHYQDRGWRILAVNLANSRGKRISEIDFIALKAGHINFVEVKTRRKIMDRFGGALAAVDRLKQQKLRTLMQLFLLNNRQYCLLQPQIDVCLVYLPDLDNSQFSVTIIPHAVSDLY